MSNPLTLHVEGSDASDVSDALQILLKEQFHSEAQVQNQQAKTAGEGEKSIPPMDVMNIASFVFTVGGFLLAVESLVNRLRNKSKLEAFEEASRALLKNRDASIWVMVAGKPYKLEAQNIDSIHEALNKQTDS